MSYINTGLNGYCEALLRGMELYGCSGIKHTPVGTLQSLFDPSNTAGIDFQKTYNQRRNKPSVRVKYLQRTTINDAVDYATCEPTIADWGYIDKTYGLTLSASIATEISLNTLLLYCDDATSVINSSAGSANFGASNGYFKEHLNTYYTLMDGLRQKINEKVIAAMAANVGVNNSTGNNLPKSLCFIDAVNGGKSEKGITDLISDLAENEINCTPLIVGFGNFFKYNTSLSYGCCNYGGLNFDAMNQAALHKFYYDTRVPKVLGASNDFFVYEPGAVQFVYYNITKPLLQNGYPNTGDTIYGMIPDELVPGLIYNMKIEKTNCAVNNGRSEIDIRWTLSLWLDFDIVFLPTDVYKDGDNLYTNNGIVNGLLRYTATAC